MAHEFTPEQQEALDSFGRVFFDILGKSASTLIRLTEVLMPQEMVDGYDRKYAEELIAENEEFLRIRELLSQPIEILRLSAETHVIMRTANIRNIGDIVRREEVSFLKYRHFGRRHLDELTRAIEGLGLHFGMYVDKYLED
ncbi:MAG: DNA-directed RNA polymerase subunit alpha C-terminal domain-containing protein [bacterium]|nr:DNA-directed RNA polymerase subunit alpha C-terminal domain-containing protein [bacterium]